MTDDSLEEAAREAAAARVSDDISLHQAILNALVVLLQHEADKERRCGEWAARDEQVAK